MYSLRLHFEALRRKIEPTEDRQRLARKLGGALREWLEENDFATGAPHTRLIGSYGRSTAVLWIKDVDVVVFLPEDALERTPDAVLLGLRRVLEGYPEAAVSAVGQCRSIRVDFDEHGFRLDVVPAVAPDGLGAPLRVPDRAKAQWIDSDPLGYGKHLSRVNRENGGKVVPLVKLVKAWRDEVMTIRRPKSYLLEVMVLRAVENNAICTDGASWPALLGGLFGHWASKYADLMDEGSGVPRVLDPQVGHLISSSWSRNEFETFLRRVRDAERAAERALEAENEAEAAEEWGTLFAKHWPSAAELEEEAEREARDLGPGRSSIASSGLVLGTSERTIPVPRTRYHGR